MPVYNNNCHDVIFKLADEELSTTSLKFGDVIFTRAQMEEKLRALGIDLQDRRKRSISNFDRFPTGKWSLPIKYVLSPIYTGTIIMYNS